MIVEMSAQRWNVRSLHKSQGGSDVADPRTLLPRLTGHLRDISASLPNKCSATVWCDMVRISTNDFGDGDREWPTQSAGCWFVLVLGEDSDADR